MVFESVLEKVLVTAAGKYITGINSKNLSMGVFSGNVEVKNVGI